MRRFFSFLSLFFSFVISCSNSDPVNFLTIDARNGSAKRSLRASENDQTYLLIPFSAPPTVSLERGNYQLRLTSKTVTRADLVRNHAARSDLSSHPATQQVLAQVRHEAQRRAEDQISLENVRNTLRNHPTLFRTTLYSLRSNRSNSAEPETNLNLYSPFAGEINQSIHGVLRSSSSTSAIYIDARANDSVTDDQIQAIKEGFDSISLPRLHALFGQEPDIDRNGRVILYLANKAQIGAGQVGFFRPIDLLPDGLDPRVRSNQAEVVYAQIPEVGSSLDLTHATLAHEIFHLIHFGQKSLARFIQSGGQQLIQEEVFLNEGLAHLAEDLVGWGVCTPLMAAIYLECLSHTSLAGSGDNSVEGKPYCEVVSSEGDGLPRRGGMMIFLMYLFQQWGGAEYSNTVAGNLSGSGISLLRNLLSSIQTGITNVEVATGRSFFSWNSDFAALLALDHSSITHDSRFDLRSEVTDTLTGKIRNLRLRGTRNNEAGLPLTLSGPAISQSLSLTASDSVNRSLFSSGLDVLEIHMPALSETELILQGPAALSLGMAIVRTQ